MDQASPAPDRRLRANANEGSAVGTGSIMAVGRRGVVVLAALRRLYEPRLWRDEARAQLARLLSGKRMGTVGGRDHDGAEPRCYRSRCGEPRLWLRPGTGDGAVWGEINVSGVYQPPWPVVTGSRVLDLGGHAGYFARWALTNWSVGSLISVEPDAANAELLARNADELADRRWSLVRAAVSTSVGSAAFAGGRGSGSGLSQRGEDVVQTVDGLELLAASDVAKIDIEGAEWSLLEDPRFAASGPPLLVLEYHPATGVTNPFDEARGWLQRHGYEVRAGPPASVPGVGILWARRPRHAKAVSSS